MSSHLHVYFPSYEPLYEVKEYLSYIITIEFEASISDRITCSEFSGRTVTQANGTESAKKGPSSKSHKIWKSHHSSSPKFSPLGLDPF